MTGPLCNRAAGQTSRKTTPAGGVERRDGIGRRVGACPERDVVEIHKPHAVGKLAGSKPNARGTVFSAGVVCETSVPAAVEFLQCAVSLNLKNSPVPRFASR